VSDDADRTDFAIAYPSLFALDDLTTWLPYEVEDEAGEEVVAAMDRRDHPSTSCPGPVQIIGGSPSRRGSWRGGPPGSGGGSRANTPVPVISGPPTPANGPRMSINDQ
jgi:hypothetical protein